VQPRHAWYGDASLQPNTGRTNSYDYALFGLALNELLDRLRLSIIISSLLLFLVVFFTWWQHLLHPFQLVLSLVVGFMVLVILVVEVSSIFRGEGTESASILSNQQGDTSNQALVKRFLQAVERGGLLILYHPIGKTIYLVVCGALCWIVGGIADWLLALLFFANAAVLLYCWITYPEFRRTFQPSPDEDSEEIGSHESPPRAASWSPYKFASPIADAATKLSHSVR
jgi:hypothetical protein